MPVPPIPPLPTANLELVLNSVQQSVVVTDLNGTILYWNRAAEMLYGWTAAEALGNSVSDLTTPETSRTHAGAIMANLKQGQNWSGQFLVQHKDGTLFTASISNAPLVDAGGQLTGIVGVSVLFDANRQIEETIAKLAAVVHITEDVVLGFSLDGTILSWNPVAERMIGLPAEAVIGKSGFSLMPLEQHDALKALVNHVGQGNYIEDYETSFTNAHGIHYDIRLSLSPIHDLSGKVIGGAAIVRNLTEQKRTERLLKQSEELHRLILSSISDAVFITDEDGNFTYICPNVDVIWGYTSAQVAQFGNISHLLGSTLCDSDALTDVGELHNLECEVMNVDGQPRWLLVNIKRVDIVGGTRLYTCRDTSERKQIMGALQQQTARLETELAERKQVDAALRHSEYLLRKVLEALPVGVWVTDETGRVTMTNPAVDALWGGDVMSGGEPRDKYVGWFTATGERIRYEDWGLSRAIMFHESTSNVLIDIEAFDGTRKTMLDSATPIYSDDGRLLGAIAVNQDVTELQRVQQSEQEERRFAAALGNIVSDLSSTLEMDSVLQSILYNIGQVVPHDAANITLIEGDIAVPACWRGYSKDAESYFENLRYPLSTPWIAQMLATGEADLVNDVASKPNWPTTPALAWIGSILSVPIRAHDTIIGFLNLDTAAPGFYTPVHRERLMVFASQAAIAIENAQLYTQTRQHAAELEERVRVRTLALEQALAKEKELGELKSRFVSMVSHEFRTPLASIQTSSDLLQHYFDRMTTERRGEALLKIQSEIKRLTSILENVLAFGRAEAVGIDIHPEPVDLFMLCSDVVAQVQQSMRHEHPIVLSTNRQHGSIVLDAKVFRHALTNLLENAAKYSPSGSAITLRVALLDRVAVISVSDNGIGIPAEDLPQLFEAFHRGRNVGSAPGTGLGLVIVKQAVEAHHGTINVDSRPDHGTTFTLTLPTTQH